ncbi:hypothetical protein [Streptomyces sp. M92]|uniref:hypothetical protein n=1 Tax=Streptomyces sp. M92 TaxID=2944250 RepID=UPI00234BD61D|nr:hypothetical protein [Streptomyces sp. M92]WCN05105.1 hypothetical protein M6G08_24995 [Streptomyces sp. M92]
MNDFWSAGSQTRNGEWAGEEGRTPFPEDVNGTSDGGAGLGRMLSCLGIVVLVLAVLVGGIVWLFQDALFHPFGDARACKGSDVQLPGVIRAGGASIPAGASDVHYFTRNGSAEVTFVSRQIPDYLHRAGILPDGERLFDEEYGTKAVADDEIEPPGGLCGSPLRGPVWIYHSTSATGSSVNVMVERSPAANDSFRFPARAVVTYNLP